MPCGFLLAMHCASLRMPLGAKGFVVGKEETMFLASVSSCSANPDFPRLKPDGVLASPDHFKPCACGGLYLRSSRTKPTNFRLRNNSVSNIIPCLSRQHGDFWWPLVSKNELGKTNYAWRLDIWKKFSRCVIMRSELAKTGGTGAPYPLSELELVPRVRAICFYAVTALTSIFLFTLMAIAHPFVLLVDRARRKVHHAIAKFWATLSVAPFYKVEFDGLANLPAPNTPAVYVSNHQSFLDIYTLLKLGRCFKFISKRAIFLFPVVGWAMLMMGVIPLKRLDRKSQSECLKRCIDLIKMGASVFFFPEGTRSKDGRLGAFKKGAFSVAAKTRVPVVPITLLGTGNIMPAGMEGRLNAGSVKVVIHKPIEGTNADMLCQEARTLIAEVLNHQG